MGRESFWLIYSVFLRCFRDLIHVHSIREIRSLQVHIGHLTFSLKKNPDIFVITSIFCISYMEPLFAMQKNGITWQERSQYFCWEWLVNDFINHCHVESNCYSHLFCNSWKLIQSTSKNLTKFVLEEAMALSLSFWLRYCYLANITFFFIWYCFEFDYDHYSKPIVAFGNARITLLPKNVQCL